MADEEESNLREIWRISTYVITAFTLLLNLIILVLVIAKRSFKSEANFGKFLGCTAASISRSVRGF